MVWGAPWPTWLGWIMNPGLVIVMIIFIFWIESYRNMDQPDIEVLVEKEGGTSE